MFISILARWFLNACAFLLTAYLLSGVSIENLYIALILAALFGFLNAVIKPIIHVLALPLTILTLGLFAFVINGFLFWLPSTFIKGFYIANFWWAILGAFFVSLFSWIFSKFID